MILSVLVCNVTASAGVVLSSLGEIAAALALNCDDDMMTAEFWEGVISGGSYKWVYDELNKLWVDPTTGIGYGIDSSGRLYRSGRGGGGSLRAVDSPDDIEISGDTFAVMIEQINNHYAPKANTEYVSLQHTDSPRSQLSSAAHTTLPFFVQGKILNYGTFEPVYITPFYRSSEGYTYISRYQYYCYFTELDDNGKRYLKVDKIDNLGVEDTVISISSAGTNVVTYQWIDLRLYNGYFQLRSYSSYANWTSLGSTSVGAGVGLGDYLRTDNQGVTLTQLDFVDNFTFTYADRSDHLPLDYGYYVNKDQLAFDGWASDIDPSLIPGDTYVTIDGDNIYEYHIENEEGDSTTVYNYIYNDYTFPEDSGSDSDDGDSDSDSDGGTGNFDGDVTVGGQVNVDGKIDVGGSVDININVSSTPADNDDDQTTIEMPDVEVDDLPEAPRDFLTYLGNLFMFLPAEVLALIVGGIAAAIFCRVWGR